MGYGMNWILFVEERLMSPLRKAAMRAWVAALLAPLKTMHTSFLQFKATREQEITITPQVRVLTYWLNELFDFDDRRFVIEDYEAQDPVFMPLFLPTFLSGSAFDFVVKAPCEAFDDRVAIRAFLDKYKLAGMRYELRFVDASDNPCIQNPTS